MPEPPGLSRQLSRRQFLQRAAMATAATALASGAYGIARSKGSAEAREVVPTLDVAGRVNGVAAVGDRLVAVGALLGGEVAVWTHRLGEASWSRSATGSAFPPHTVLAGVAGIGESTVAVGYTRELSRIETIVDDQAGRPLRIPIFATVSAAFSSSDGARWEQVLRGVPGSPLGAFGAVASIDGRGRVLAVGSRFLEPGICEGYGLIAMTSGDRSKWERTDLPGVTPPRHGAVTLLARLGDSTMLATRAIRDSSLYFHSGGTWSPIDGPARRVSYTAAGEDGRRLILAGVDDSGASRIWTRAGQGWREAGRLGGIPPGARLTDIEEIDGALIAAGSSEGMGFVRSIGG